MVISNRNLAKIAGWGGIALVTTVALMKDSIKKRIQSQDYYKEALRNLRAHPGAVTLLGEPIRDFGFKIENKENFADGKDAHFQVKVKGVKKRGIMYFWAINEDQWRVTRIELELDDQPDKRLLIKKESNPSEE